MGLSVPNQMPPYPTDPPPQQQASASFVAAAAPPLTPGAAAAAAAAAHPLHQQQYQGQPRRWYYPKAHSVAVAALAATQAAACVAIMATIVLGLLYTSPAPPGARMCRLGPDPSATAPCDYGLALAAVALAASLALLLLQMGKIVADMIKAAAEEVVTHVRLFPYWVFSHADAAFER
jgi:hypothetical protein